MDNNIFNIKEIVFRMVEVMFILYSIIWYGVQNTVKSFSKWNRCGMQRNVTRIGGRVSLQILAMEVMPDHIHLLVDCRPQFFISDMIKIMKGILPDSYFFHIRN